MTREVSPTDALPLRVSRFAPWTWRRRWAIPALMVVMLLIYAASVSPADYLLNRLGLVRTPIGTTYRVVYGPLIWLMEDSPVVHRFFRSQLLWLYATFG